MVDSEIRSAVRLGLVRSCYGNVVKPVGNQALIEIAAAL